MSRWTRPLAWAAASPSAISRPMRRDLGGRQLALALQAVLQRFALEQGHGQEGHAAILADVMDGDDVIVLHGGGGLCFTQEALAVRRFLGQAGQHGLEGHRPFQLGVLGEEDDAHAAAAEHLEHAVRTESAHLVGLLRRSQQAGQMVPILRRGGSRSRYRRPGPRILVGRRVRGRQRRGLGGHARDRNGRRRQGGGGVEAAGWRRGGSRPGCLGRRRRQGGRGSDGLRRGHRRDPPAAGTANGPAGRGIARLKTLATTAAGEYDHKSLREGDTKIPGPIRSAAGPAIPCCPYARPCNPDR